jgi:hypothetical protein
MDFLTYAKSLNPSVLSLPIMGHLNTYDGYGRAVTYNGTPFWGHTFQGPAFTPIQNGLYAIADGPEQDFTDQTIFIYTPDGVKVGDANAYFLSKFDASGGAWVVYLTTAGVLQFYKGDLAANRSTTLTNLDKISSLCIRSIASSNVDFYTSGSLYEAKGGLDLTSQGNAKIYVGNYYNLAFFAKTLISIVAIFPSALTNEQIELLHYYATKIRYGYQPKIRSYVPRKDDKGAVVHYTDLPNFNGELIDKTNSGSDGSESGFVSNHNDGIDKKIEFHGTGQGRVIIPSSTTIDDLSAHTHQFMMHQKSAGEGTFGRIFSKGDKHQLYNSGVNYNYGIDYSDGFGVWQFPVILNNDLFIQLSHTHSDATDLPVCYINGTQETVSVSAAKTGTKDSDSGLDLLLGNRVALDRTADMYLSDYKYFPSKLSTNDLRDEYVKYATGHVIRHTSRFEYPVTLSAVSAPNQVGPWSTWANTHEWLDDGTKRYLRSTALNSYASIPAYHAYGAYYFEYKPQSGGTFAGPVFSFSDYPDLRFNVSPQNGYIIWHNATESIQIYKITSGAASLVAGSTSNWLPTDGSEIKIFFVRRLIDGEFTLYTKEANHTTWTQALQGTDNTFTTTKYHQTYCNAGGPNLEMYDIISWPYGDSLLPNDIKEIAD